MLTLGSTHNQKMQHNLDPDNRAGEGGEAHGGDGEGIRRREGPDVAGEHAKLERLLEQFCDWIRRSRAEERRASPAPSRTPPTEPRAGASMPSSRASSATSAEIGKAHV